MTPATAVEPPRSRWPIGWIREWSMSTATGSFLLYLAGYLSLRFHMTVLGITTDLSVLDERYLFAGARFLVFFASCIPYIAIGAALLAGAGVLVWKALPGRWRVFWSRPLPMLVAGIVIAVAATAVMRSCFVLTGASLPFVTTLRPHWVERVLRGSDELKSLFFVGLVLAAAIPWAIVAAAIRIGLTSTVERVLAAAVAAMAAILVLLLPVNHGTMLMPYEARRTSAIGKTALAPGERAWVIWEGKERISYYVRSVSQRSIVSLPWSAVERQDDFGSDSLTDVALSGAAVTTPVDVQASNEPWWQKTARALGMGDTGLKLKAGTAEETAPGDIWLAAVDGTPAPRAVGKYQWPIVQSGKRRIFALEGETLVRMPIDAGTVERLERLPKARRLVGFDTAGENFLALLSRDDQHLDAVFVSADGKQMQVVAQNIDLEDEGAQALLSPVSAYGNVLVSAENGKISVDREILDHCSPARCSQASYSPDAKMVVYIKSATQGNR